MPSRCKAVAGMCTVNLARPAKGRLDQAIGHAMAVADHKVVADTQPGIALASLRADVRGRSSRRRLLRWPYDATRYISTSRRRPRLPACRQTRRSCAGSGCRRLKRLTGSHQRRAGTRMLGLHAGADSWAVARRDRIARKATALAFMIADAEAQGQQSPKPSVRLQSPTPPACRTSNSWLGLPQSSALRRRTLIIDIQCQSSFVIRSTRLGRCQQRCSREASSLACYKSKAPDADAIRSPALAIAATSSFTASTLFWKSARSWLGELQLDDPLDSARAEDRPARRRNSRRRHIPARNRRRRESAASCRERRLRPSGRWRRPGRSRRCRS